jgi:hypothetical protein
MVRRPARRGTNAAAATDGVEPVGTIRRSQLVSTFGIGAIVDLEKGSFMPMGLEDWERVNGYPSLRIGERRLEEMLGVSHFRLGPIQEPIPGSSMVRARSAAPAVRFPEFHECPRCHRIGTLERPFETAADGVRLQCTAHTKPIYTNPVRFVVACRRGHLSDFPWSWWAHRDREGGECERPALYLKSRGRSASLSDLYVSCEACSTPEKPVSRSMGDAFGADVLSGSECSGYRPWLGNREHDCPETKRTLQRGGSNVHFPVVCSTLSIPPDSEAINQILEELRMVLDATPPDAVPQVLQGIAANYDIDAERLVRAWQQINTGAAGYAGLTEKMARSEEYAALSETKHDDPIGHIVPQFENTVLDPPAALAPYFDIIGAVSRLREVRALAGFSRIEPYPVSAENVAQAIADGKVSPLSKTNRNWLPGAEIRGEGIFLRFRTDVIDEWAATQGPALAQRLADIEARSQAVADKRGYTRDYAITARLLVVHAFAHALIRQISVECGYSAAALRERLFVSEPEGSRTAENGVLIYTGSPDSEGSLGGLVRLAEPDLLEPIVLRALQNSSWCGSDPVCLETDPSQSGDRVSGAACHCCLLLPETACEKFNRELDRTMLVGSADRSFQGFFHELLEQLEWQS